MRKSRPKSVFSRKVKAEQLFIRAGREEEKGNLRRAFRLFLVGAKLGEQGCQLNVGNYYDDAKGVRRTRALALYWYKRAYRGSFSTAAYNIGILWRNDGNPKRASEWFKRAVCLGDDEANLEIAKHYLQNENNPALAIHYLEKVCSSDWVSEAGAEEAVALLKEAKKPFSRR